MSRSLLVSRTELSLSDLQLWDPPTFLLPEGGFSIGPQTHRREVATSPFTPGRYLIGLVPDVQTNRLVVQVRGTSGADLRAQVTTVLAAFTQSTYTVTSNYDGLIGSWACEPADYSVGAEGVVDEFDLSFYEQAVTLLFPRSPLVLSGPI